MSYTSGLCFELLKLIEHQSELIAKLTSENIEKENLINSMLIEKSDLSN
ncbi:hypothetical protein HNR53_003100 [Bacillus benzoevorans]|uniref:Uncharacterized protein n=1 Tax=Bacillus benzoevorans TaxID=1456 RepID=A0A7X0LVW3_9BACI|nr:hypothetical protein [Bacillus benzoevorans]